MDAVQCGNVFRSNSGRGPWTAVVEGIGPLDAIWVDAKNKCRLRVSAGHILLAIRRDGRPQPSYAELPERFLASPACGWKPVTPAVETEERKGAGN